MSHFIQVDIDLHIHLKTAKKNIRKEIESNVSFNEDNVELGITVIKTCLV